MKREADRTASYGDRRNNTIKNFTIVIKYANAAKAECTSYEEDPDMEKNYLKL